MWVRGLKHERMRYDLTPQKSHPVWVRGLKLLHHARDYLDTGVAPRVGAWIETVWTCPRQMYNGVAPRVGAWIETLALV